MEIADYKARRLAKATFTAATITDLVNDKVCMVKEEKTGSVIEVAYDDLTKVGQ